MGGWAKSLKHAGFYIYRVGTKMDSKLAIMQRSKGGIED